MRFLITMGLRSQPSKQLVFRESNAPAEPHFTNDARSPRGPAAASPSRKQGDRIQIDNGPRHLPSPNATKKTRQERNGAAAVEFAIVLPILITLLLGATDFGRVSHSTISIANAARCGAEFASMNPYDSSTQNVWTQSVAQAVTDELSQSPAFDLSKVIITVSTINEGGGLRRVSVQVTYPFKTIVNWSMLPSSVNLQQTVALRVIR